MYFETEEDLKANFVESLAPRLIKSLKKPGWETNGWHQPEFRKMGFSVNDGDVGVRISCALFYIAFKDDNSVSGAAWVVERVKFVIMQKVSHSHSALQFHWTTYIDYDASVDPVYILNKLNTVADYEDHIVSTLNTALDKKRESLTKRYKDAAKFSSYHDLRNDDLEWLESDAKEIYQQIRALKGMEFK